METSQILFSSVPGVTPVPAPTTGPGTIASAAATEPPFGTLFARIGSQGTAGGERTRSDGRARAEPLDGPAQDAEETLVAGLAVLASGWTFDPGADVTLKVHGSDPQVDPLSPADDAIDRIRVASIPFRDAAMPAAAALPGAEQRGPGFETGAAAAPVEPVAADAILPGALLSPAAAGTAVSVPADPPFDAASAPPAKLAAQVPAGADMRPQPAEVLDTASVSGQAGRVHSEREGPETARADPRNQQEGAAAVRSSVPAAAMLSTAHARGTAEAAATSPAGHESRPPLRADADGGPTPYEIAFVAKAEPSPHGRSVAVSSDVNDRVGQLVASRAAAQPSAAHKGEAAKPETATDGTDDRSPRPDAPASAAEAREARLAGAFAAATPGAPEARPARPASDEPHVRTAGQVGRGEEPGTTQDKREGSVGEARTGALAPAHANANSATIAQDKPDVDHLREPLETSQTPTAESGPRAEVQPLRPAGPTSPVHGAPGAEHALRIGQQLADSVTRTHRHEVEIRLAPEELGSVRMTVSRGDGTIALAIHADRADTIDLMRRNIDTLAQGFRDLGFADVSFSFAQGQQMPDPGGRAAAAERTELLGDTQGDPARPVAEALPTGPARTTRPGGLDLRF